MPAPTVKSASMAGGKWQRRASSASGEYKAGVEGTQRSWQQAAAASKQAWQQGVTEAAGRDAFAKGVNAAGDSKWRTNASAKGPGRFAEGVSIATPDFERGIAPYLEVMSRTDLPARGATGSESNYQRSTTIAKANRALKVGRK